MINFPKTGSSFARKVIKELYRNRLNKVYKLLFDLNLYKSYCFELFLPIIDEEIRFGKKTQHGTLRQIPPKYKNRTIISIIRNPFYRYISQYNFGWWKEHPPADISIIKQKFPNFPNLSFEEFFELNHTVGINNWLKGVRPQIPLGLYSIQFIQFFFNEPEKIIESINDEYIEKEKYIVDMGNVLFLHQENLINELKRFLLPFGFSLTELSILDNTPKVNVSTKSKIFLKDYYNQNLINQILKRDKLIFKIFPEYLP